MNDPNITMEEHYYEEERYMNFEEEFSAIVFGKINGNSFDSEQGGIMREYNDGREDFETEFPATVFNNTSDTTPPCESTVSPPNENELDFRVSCDELDDEDYTVIFDKNSFSFKIISVNDLKTVLENDNNYMALSPNLTIDHDLDYFDDFENEFPAIVYNDGLTSKSDLGIKPLVSSKSTDEFSLTDETSLSEYDKEIISRFNDLFNDIHSDNSKSELDNENVLRENRLSETMPFGIPFDPKRYYKDGSHTKVAEAKIWHHYRLLIRDTHGSDTRSRDIPRGLTPEMRQDLAVRLRMVYTGEQGQVFMSHAWRRLFEIRGGFRKRMAQRQFILALGLHTEQEMAEAGFGAYWARSDRLIPDKGDLRDYWVEILMIAYSISGRGQAPEKVTGVDLFYLCYIDRGTINVPHLLAQYLFRHAKGRKSGVRLSGRHFIGRLAIHFGLVSDEGLRGLQGPERQQAAVTGALKAGENGQAAKEVAPEIPVLAPAHEPPPPPPAS
ncbi:hypothetical protein Tco_0330998 [Tanacetum coccineum]